MTRFFKVSHLGLNKGFPWLRGGDCILTNPVPRAFSTPMRSFSIMILSGSGTFQTYTYPSRSFSISILNLFFPRKGSFNIFPWQCIFNIFFKITFLCSFSTILQIKTTIFKLFTDHGHFQFPNGHFQLSQEHPFFWCIINMKGS